MFIRLAVIASYPREMSRNSKRICPYSSSRSSKVIDLGVSGKPICDFLSPALDNFGMKLALETLEGEGWGYRMVKIS